MIFFCTSLFFFFYDFLVIDFQKQVSAERLQKHYGKLRDAQGGKVKTLHKQTKTQFYRNMKFYKWSKILKKM